MALIKKLEELIDKAEDAISYDLTSDNLVVSVHDLLAIIAQHKAECEPVMCNCNTGEWQGQLCVICNGTGKANPPDQLARIKELEQILHDPENQPSQYGTMPLIEYEKIVAQRNKMIDFLKDFNANSYIDEVLSVKFCVTTCEIQEKLKTLLEGIEASK